MLVFIVGLAGCATFPERTPGHELKLDAYVSSRLDAARRSAEIQYAYWFTTSCHDESLLTVRSDGTATLEIFRDGTRWTSHEWSVPADRMAELRRRAIADHVDEIPILDRNAPNNFRDGPPDVLVVRAVDGFHLTHRIPPHGEWRDFERDLSFQTNVRERLATAE